MTPPRSYYELLGVSQSADAMMLRGAFRRLSKALHPDTTSLPSDEAARKFQELCEAYELLSDPLLSRAYDETRELFNSSEKPTLDECFALSKDGIKNYSSMEVRRSFSGSELLSLLLLGVALFFSLLLAIVFAFTQGRELQSQPSWLTIDPLPGIVIVQYQPNVSNPFSSNSFESTFFGSFRSLVQ